MTLHAYMLIFWLRDIVHMVKNDEEKHYNWDTHMFLCFFFQVFIMKNIVCVSQTKCFPTCLHTYILTCLHVYVLLFWWFQGVILMSDFKVLCRTKSSLDFLFQDSDHLGQKNYGHLKRSINFGRVSFKWIKIQ